ncbi:hypothetical protein ACFE04_007031 [Oxalis oulophora]
MEDDVPELFVEVDPSERYGKYAEVLGTGSTKKVYRAFDKQDGKEVAWNQVSLKRFADNEDTMNRIYLEVQLLKLISNESIISSSHAWIDRERQVLNFITEICSSGNLREYRKKHANISLMAIKRWLKQILSALEYLHTFEPCIIHGDINCSNIFINGHTGKIKVGDLGTSTVIVEDTKMAHSMIGTPEFMAPEVYKENYTEAVDIYAFGMCVLELMTAEIPYSECRFIAQIVHNVQSGVKPMALDKVTDPDVRSFIEKCLAKESERPTASELLRDGFFEGNTTNSVTSLASTSHDSSGLCDEIKNTHIE